MRAEALDAVSVPLWENEIAASRRRNTKRRWVQTTMMPSVTDRYSLAIALRAAAASSTTSSISGGLRPAVWRLSANSANIARYTIEPRANITMTECVGTNRLSRLAQTEA